MHNIREIYVGCADIRRLGIQEGDKINMESRAVRTSWVDTRWKLKVYTRGRLIASLLYNLIYIYVS